MWDEQAGIYHVDIRTSDGMVHDTCNLLINASGVLNRWKCKLLLSMQ